VSIDSVAFDYWAVSASQVQNVNRRSDFEVTLLDPSCSPVGTVSIGDVVNGNTFAPGAGTPVLLTFTSPIDLTLPGTYTLGIKAGDFIPPDETGNHTGIDNLTINGTALIPEPARGVLAMASLALLAFRRQRRG
jgi:hypothetical protein